MGAATTPEVEESPPSEADILGKYLELGITDIVSVPCSITDTWHALAAGLASSGLIRLCLSSHEGNLIGIAAGLYFGSGRPALVHMQNTGLLNAADGFVSFANPKVFGIPMAVLVTYRGWSAEDCSEPHQEIGARTDALVATLFDGGAQVFGSRRGDGILAGVAGSVAAAQGGALGILKLAPTGLRKTVPLVLPSRFAASLSDCLPALRAHKGADSLPDALRHAQPLPRDEAIQGILDAHPGAAVLFCNGFTSRAAQAVADRPGNFYNVGYMGGTLALGWGLAKIRPDLDVVVVDGDQNALMSTMKDHLLADYPPNLHWYILNNHIGASVGVAESLALSSLYASLARVMETVPDQPGSFRHPRVSAHGAYFSGEAPGGVPRTLATLANRFRLWVERSGVASPSPSLSQPRQPVPRPSAA